MRVGRKQKKHRRARDDELIDARKLTKTKSLLLSSGYATQKQTKKFERNRTLYKKLFRRESEEHTHTHTLTHESGNRSLGKGSPKFSSFEIKINNGIFANERSIYIRGRVWTTAARRFHGPRCESSSSSAGTWIRK